MSSKIWAVARYTFVGNLRNRLSLVLVLFGFLILGASVLLGLLSQELELRMLTDLGLAAMELLALITSVFLMSGIILEEMESRTIYLVLTRSLGRVEYLLGRFLGTLLSVSACVAVMVLVHVALLLAKGWKPADEGLLYAVSIFMSFEKIVLISALGLFFSLFSSSAVTAIVFTLFFWVLGHFAMELKFLASEVRTEWLKPVFKAAYYLIPHFQYMNARDLWATVSDRMGYYALYGTGYTVLYSALALLMAAAVFRKKEF